MSNEAEQFSEITGRGPAFVALAGDTVDRRARVVAMGAATGMLNDNPIVPVELLILHPGGPPRPVSMSVVVPMTQLHRMAPGATVPVKVSESNPSALVIDWYTPV